ncbi:hypothetical protein L6164_003515 [Bauhinia variegata]|uniref:Uncharacterized protein n=1 Tax=Bauhinia variegata TaxID=167791 RepID=A0ACB9Q1J4_BAUVA|nr:hypothetical protein L6164_003515 [Bauhinia variegata]
MNKKPRLENSHSLVPKGCASSMGTLVNIEARPLSIVPSESTVTVNCSPSCKQFWKAGDFESDNGDASFTDDASGGMDHIRVHPKFLHSNATSHKWALGAIAELLDNSLDEVCNGATYLRVEMVKSNTIGTPMLLVEDNGGGMTPDKMRQCMSLGYSAKSKMANTIGQYGNGFKTSTMRLGADVIVFSRCQGKDGKSTQSIGMLSYTFLRETRKEDIIVPMIDYERSGQSWQKIVRYSMDDWNRNLTTIIQWSPYKSEKELLQQFNLFKGHGTRIIIYNLWEDEEGKLELDFDTDPYDIQIRGINRDMKNIQMAMQFPNSRHFLTYRHSLRSYASILYLQLPRGFRIILRGKDIEHHNLVNDMMPNLINEITYRPVQVPEGISRMSDKVANLKLGFVKDAKHHIDIQGFNVYHKNRLIKPFWRVWNAAGSNGRGVIGVLEVNFIEPAHDKQGFERTIALSRLETRLKELQKSYWSKYCHQIGYAARRQGANSSLEESVASDKEKSSSSPKENARVSNSGSSELKPSSPVGGSTESQKRHRSNGELDQLRNCPVSRGDVKNHEQLQVSRPKTKGEILESRERLKRMDRPREELINELQYERDRRQSLEKEFQNLQHEKDQLDKEMIVALDMLQEEKTERQKVEENLRKSLREASETISELIERVKQLEGKTNHACKPEY